MTLEIIPLKTIPLIMPGDDLSEIILEAIQTEKQQLRENDILVIAQKVFSKAEDRFVSLSSVQPSEKANEIASIVSKDPAFVEMVLRESKKVLRADTGRLIVEHKLGFVCANAGIDRSNVHQEKGHPEDRILLLPEDPDLSCSRLRDRITSATQKKIGVMMIDSHGRAWRMGIIGTAIGLAGVPGLIDKRGDRDMFGAELKVTQIAAADELAAAASLVMGQADEKIPVVIVRGFPYALRTSSIKELIRPEEQDLFR
jgi:coenzyme F420-0:L-glutamate ligase/coenzyme F420-1:gamma-L-glutamate ligase